MLEKDVAQGFWKEAVHAVVHIQNRVLFKPGTKQTTYELWYGKKPTVEYFRVFGYRYFIKNKEEDKGKLVSKADEGIFLGYSAESKAYKCFNKRLRKLFESTDITVVGDEEKSDYKEEIE